ncbi:arylsulfatase [Flavobacterium algicola]|uniref:arylsulfatase n=1 Tax=Flavobacterium algicola TaxID=556529 RepID=UPI001EFDC255|nr:arylsulfatase [Flavobacterium algicola]MCG9792283.1 arylsulfatase [Flavobacterium algicola]
MKKQCLVPAIFFILSSYGQKIEQEKPNIIYIVADDMGYGDLGVYGQQKIKTPILDQMASEGIQFTQHYAGSTVCGPSRVSLMTGKHMGHSSVRGNPKWTATGNPIDIKSEEITVAEELKRAGYRTGVIGKWGLAEASDESMPLNQGFDYFYGYRDHGTAHHYYPEVLWENNRSFKTGNSTMEKKGTYSHDTFVGKAKEFVNTNKSKPFFLYLAFTIPHYELTVPEDSKEQYKHLNWDERTLKVKPNEGYQHDADGNATYAGMISRLDRDIGDLLKLLKSLNLDDNTIIIFTSDNGPEYDTNFFNSNGDLKGRKRDLYEGGIRIPFIARWPGHIKPSTKTEHISAFWDFLPTVCEIAGIKPTDATIDGISYLPTLLSNDKKQQKHEYLYWEFNENKGPIQAIRKGEWKAVKYLNKPLELYNLLNDIRETTSVADANPLVVKEMLDILKNGRTENLNFPLKFHEKLNKKEND